MKKIKTSIDISQKVVSSLKNLSQRKDTSLGNEINNILNNTVELSDEASFLLAHKIHELINELEKKDNKSETLSSDCRKKDMDYLRNLESFFNRNLEFHELNHMKKVEFPGGYCIVPEEWIVLDSTAKSDNTVLYPCVIEVKNSSRYEPSLGPIPHVLFFTEEPLNEVKNEKEILDKVCEICPAYRNIRAMQVKPMYDSNRVMLNYDLYIISPVIGFFSLPEYGDPYSSFPYNALFVRNK